MQECNALPACGHQPWAHQYYERWGRQLQRYRSERMPHARTIPAATGASCSRPGHHPCDVQCCLLLGWCGPMERRDAVRPPTQNSLHGVVDSARQRARLGCTRHSTRPGIKEAAAHLAALGVVLVLEDVGGLHLQDRAHAQRRVGVGGPHLDGAVQRARQHVRLRVGHMAGARQDCRPNSGCRRVGGRLHVGHKAEGWLDARHGAGG
jgi:hypothetical protein